MRRSSMNPFRTFHQGIIAFVTATAIALCATPVVVAADDVARRPGDFGGSTFTGEVLPVLYVHDVQASVAFYVDKLGFTCDHYFDHISGGSTYEWTYDEPPLYAEMRAGAQKFALHRAPQPESLIVGGTRHYFSVSDVRAHLKAVRARGVETGDLVERPWMDMFRVIDPDGHELFIFTRPPESAD